MYRAKKTCLSFAAYALILCTPAAVADEAVSIYFGATNAVIQPKIAGDAVSLSVSCSDGTYLQDEFQGTASVGFDLRDEDSQSIEDGWCKYEVHIHPQVDEAAVKAAMDAGDDWLLEELDRAEQERTVIVRGSIEIVGGTIVVPDVKSDADSSESNSHD